MDDRFEMENLLICAKSICDLLLHGTIESSTVSVNNAMNESLNDALMIQNAIYKQMEFNGWYNVTEANKANVTSTASKLAANA